MEILKTEHDFYTSVEKALHEIDPKWDKYRGLLLLGTHTPLNIEEKMERLKEARENNTPTLGICMGMQLMAIEFARNVLKIPAANTQEVDTGTKFPIIQKLPKLRVGIREVEWAGKTTQESHWHNYAFIKDPRFTPIFRRYWEISFTDDIAEVMSYKDHPFYLGVQFHPEYQSVMDNPHPILKEFIYATKMAM